MQRLLRFVLLLSCTLCWGFSSAEQPSSNHPSWTKPDGDLYIDDEGLEGSGGGSHRGLKDDLESSGSGYGPDDEDDADIVVDKTRIDFGGSEKKPKVHDIELTPPPAVHGVDEGPVHPATPDPHHPDVHILGRKNEDRPASFFAQPGILAAVIGGAVVGLFCAILLVMFIVYRMRKKDEGSYALDEPKRSPTVNSYTRSSNKEFYA